MLHIVAFTVVSILLVAVTAGIAVMLYAARDGVSRALQGIVPVPAPVIVEPSRVRVVRTARGRRVMPPLRAAA